MKPPLIAANGLGKSYRQGRQTVAALDDFSLLVEAGEFLAVEGRSGSGKTTLLMILGGMAQPTTGSLMVNGRDIYGLSARARARFRAETIGFVFQASHLVPYLSVLDNILLAHRRGHGRERALELAALLGLKSRLAHRPGQLSAGEAQRVALARAMLNTPPIILADEPTGNLDEENTEIVFAALSRYRNDGGTVLVVSHGPTAARVADRRLVLECGCLFSGNAEMESQPCAGSLF